MNILIIGASGFVANCLIKRLSNRKDLRILAVSRNIGHVAEEFNDSENVFFQKFDFLNDDPSKFDFSSDVVINLMSQQPSSDQISWQNYIEGNVKTVSSLLDTIKIQNVGKIIQFSTSSVYSSSQSPINDLTEPQPDNYYGLSKFMGESLLKISKSRNEFISDTCILRFPSIYGDIHHAGLVHTFYSLARSNQDIELFNEGKSIRNIIYIEDVIDIVELLINKDLINDFEVFNLGSKNHLSTYEIAKIVVDELNSSSKLIPIKSSSSTSQDVIINVEKFSKCYNYEPQDIERSLKRYIKSKASQ